MSSGRFRDLKGYLQETFAERVQKISLDAGLGCPNRDGTLSRKGCIFCDPRGSGTGLHPGLSLGEQIHRAKAFLSSRYGVRKYIAYFQSFTNTYGPVERLKALYDQALDQEDMVGLSVGTRPDCVDEGILTLLSSYQKTHHVWIEYGLQSAHDRTLQQINRGHDVACFERAVRKGRAHGLNICAHVILGLPGEDRAMMLETARFISTLPIDGVKIHGLYVVPGTPLAQMYLKGKYLCLGQDEYARVVVDFLELLPPDMVIHRLTGDPPGRELLAPSWAVEKAFTLHRIQEELRQRDTWQGRRYGG